MIRTFFISLCVTTVTFADTWTVGVDGTTDFNSIQVAIDAASNGDAILVMAGKYDEHNINTNGKAILIEGETGASGALLAIVHGSWQDSVFVCNSGETNSTILKNLVITGGSSFTGGGLYIEASSPSVVGCTFLNNFATKGFGGGICAIDSELSLVDCTFTGNIGGVGGGVYNQPEYGSVHEIRGCSFQMNQAVNGNYGHGGGLKHGSGFLQLTDCEFIENTASGGGGGVSEFASIGINIRNCKFMYNNALSGGGLDTSGIGGCTIVSSSFIGNQSKTYGGGIQSSSPSLALMNCRLSNNVTGWLGGAVTMLYADQQPAIFVNCLMDNNTAYVGATVSIHGTMATKFINTTIINNVGPGLALQGWEGQYVQIYNSVIWGNDPISIAVDGEIGVDVQYSDIEGGWAGEGNFNANPLIILSNGEVLLDIDSPCIDTGNISFLPSDFYDLDADGDVIELLPLDLLGGIRIRGTTVDVGPIEFQNPYCIGDLNGDAVVNVSDLLLVIDQWGNVDSPADINGDGIVNVSDLLEVVGHWGACM